MEGLNSLWGNDEERIVTVTQMMEEIAEHEYAYNTKDERLLTEIYMEMF